MVSCSGGSVFIYTVVLRLITIITITNNNSYIYTTNITTTTTTAGNVKIDLVLVVVKLYGKKLIKFLIDYRWLQLLIMISSVFMVEFQDLCTIKTIVFVETK